MATQPSLQIEWYEEVWSIQPPNFFGLDADTWARYLDQENLDAFLKDLYAASKT